MDKLLFPSSVSMQNNNWKDYEDSGKGFIPNNVAYLPINTASFFVIKPTRCTNFTNLFCHETLHVSDSSSVHHQLSSRSICSSSKVVYKTVWHIPLLSVQWINSWWWTDELSETCRFSWQNKFVKLVHLVGFIIKKFVTMHGHMSRCTVTWT